ncbi:MAG: molybdenum cofactor guanylyltransferase [Clostridium sp.]|nr:molybdenum cofactor guanylyltransferase [Clostridium sp.]
MKIAALVLVGGKSTRMKGDNKAFLTLNNKRFIDIIIDNLQVLNKIYISVDNKEKYKELDYELIEDEYKEIGPIGGLYSSFKYIKEDYIFVTACDMPKLSSEFVEFILSNLEEGDTAVVSQDSKGRLYPLGGVYSKKIFPIIEDMIKDKRYKLTDLVKNIEGKVISLENTKFDKDVLINVNNYFDYHNLK